MGWRPRRVSVESDGKVGGGGGWIYEGAGSSANFALARYDASGKLDTVFGGTGIVISEVATTGKNDTASAIVLQSDERIPTTRVLVAGSASTSNSQFAIARATGADSHRTAETVPAKVPLLRRHHLDNPPRNAEHGNGRG